MAACKLCNQTCESEPDPGASIGARAYNLRVMAASLTSPLLLLTTKARSMTTSTASSASRRER